MVNKKRIICNDSFIFVVHFYRSSMMVTQPRLQSVVRSVLTETGHVYWALLKILIPALIAVKLLQELGAIDAFGVLLAPVMTLVGLPAILGVVWATTLLTNIITGVVVFFEVAGHYPLTLEQMTVLGTLMLIGHSIPIEGAVAKRAGVPWRVTILLRTGGALLLGYLLHLVYSRIPAFQEPAKIIWQSESSNQSLFAWVLTQLGALAMIFVIILLLIVMMKLLRKFGIERLMHLALAPLLHVLGIGRSAANTTVIGVALGLSYGAGLLIRDLDKGVMSRRDSFLALCFLGLVHSLIEDTLLILALGADLSGILWARLLFSIVVIALLARLVDRWEFQQTK